MAKTEVYSWRLSTEVKAGLERRARREGVSLAALLDRLASECLRLESEDARDDARQQEALRAAARACVGAFAGGDPGRAQGARAVIRKRLGGKRHAS